MRQGWLDFKTGNKIVTTDELLEQITLKEKKIQELQTLLVLDKDEIKNLRSEIVKLNGGYYEPEPYKTKIERQQAALIKAKAMLLEANRNGYVNGLTTLAELNEAIGFQVNFEASQG